MSYETHPTNLLAEENTRSSVQELYVAFFGRPADVAGLNGWVNALANGARMIDIVKGFENSEEARIVHASKPNEEFVKALYKNLLSRQGEEAGVKAWTDALNNGSLSQSDLVSKFLESIHNQPTTSIDRIVVEQRVEAANQFVNMLVKAGRETDYSGAAVNAAREWISGIGADKADLSSALEVVERLVNSFSKGNILGVVFDGYIADASVFIDVNGDGVFSEGEPQATTDKNGNFSFPAGTASGTVIASGGKDISTGIAWVGTLKAPAGALTVTPITNLAQNLIEKGLAINVEAAENLIFKSFSTLPRIDLSVYDPTLYALKGTETQKIDGVSIQAVTAQIVNILSSGSAVLEGSGLKKGDAQEAILQSLVNKVSIGQSLDLTQTTTITDVVKAAVLAHTSDPQVIDKLQSVLPSMVAIVSEVNTRAQTAAEAFAKGEVTNPIASLSDLAKLQTLTNGKLSDDLMKAAFDGITTNLSGQYTGTGLTGTLDNTKAGSIAPGTPATDGTTITNGGSGGSGGGSAPVFNVANIVSVDSTAKTVKIDFTGDVQDGTLSNNVSTLASRITFTTDGTNYSSLPTGASVSILNGDVIVDFSQVNSGLPTSDMLKFKIDTNALKDSSGLTNSQLTSSAVDNLGPSMTSAIVSADGLHIVITYSEAVDGTLEGSDWSFSVGNSSYIGNITGATVGTGSNANKVTLDLSVAIGSTEMLSNLIYTSSSGTSDSLTDAALGQNAAVNQTLSSITNSSTVDLTAPAMSSAVVSSDGLSIVITYSEHVTGTLEAGDWTVSVGGPKYLTNAYSGTINNAVVGTGANANKITLTLSSAIEAGSTVSSLVYTASSGIASSVKDTAPASNSADTQTLGLLTNNSTVDTTAPSVSFFDVSNQYFNTAFLTVASNETGTIKIGSSSLSNTFMLGKAYLSQQTNAASGKLTVTDAANNSGSPNPDIDFALGTSSGETLDGDYVFGFGGNDTLGLGSNPSNGVHYLGGGDGNDIINVTAGNTTVSTGSGTDVVNVSAGSLNEIHVDGGAGTKTIYATTTGLSSGDFAASVIVNTASATVTGVSSANGASTAALSFNVNGIGAHVTGGDGDDRFVAYGNGGTLTGGLGANIYQFDTIYNSGSGGASATKIADLKIGDVIQLPTGNVNFITNTVATDFTGSGITFTSGTDVFLTDIVTNGVSEYYIGYKNGSDLTFVDIGPSIPGGFGFSNWVFDATLGKMTVAADAVAPTVTSIAITSATAANIVTTNSVTTSYLNAGDDVFVTVTMDEVTTVTGTPQLALNIGGTTVQADFDSGSGTTALVFKYTILTNQNDSNGISIAANALSLNGGTLRDAAGNNTVLTHSLVLDNANYIVDAIAPSFDYIYYNHGSLNPRRVDQNEPVSISLDGQEVSLSSGRIGVQSTAMYGTIIKATDLAGNISAPFNTTGTIPNFSDSWNFDRNTNLSYNSSGNSVISYYFGTVAGDGDASNPLTASAVWGFGSNDHLRGRYVVTGTGDDHIYVDTDPVISGDVEVLADGAGYKTLKITNTGVNVAAVADISNVTIDASSSVSTDKLTLVSNWVGSTTLIGTGGKDTFYSLGGGSVLTGGLGTDTFFCENDYYGYGADTITDFLSGSSGDILKFDARNLGLGTVSNIKMANVSNKWSQNDEVIIITETVNSFANTDVAAKISACASSFWDLGPNVSKLFLVSDGVSSAVFQLVGDGSGGISDRDITAGQGKIINLTGVDLTKLQSMTFADNFLFV